MYIENIDEILKECWKPINTINTINTINNTKSQCETTTNNQNCNNNNTAKIPFAMKSFQTMYNQFLYKKSLRQKTVEKKQDDIQLIQSFEDLDKLNTKNKEINNEE